MRALVYEGPYTMPLRDVPAPTPGPGEVLIDVKAVGICGSDVHGYTGSTGRRTAPMIMGHEFSGIISGVGDGVTLVKPGDAVVPTPMFPHNNIGQRKVLGVFSTNGAYADQVVVHESMVLPKPDHVTWQQAAMCEPLSIALHALSRTPVKQGDTVVVVGAGTIGMLAMLAARLKGAGRIIMTDMSPHRLEMAEEMGADLTINIKDQDPVKIAIDYTNGMGVDCAIEAVGITPAVQQAHKMTRNGGHITWIGNSAKMIEVDMQEVVTRELSVSGTYGFQEEFPQALAAIASGKINVDAMIERIAPLEDGPQIMDDLARGRIDLLKVVLEL